MNSTQKRYADRIRELIEESITVESLVITPSGNYEDPFDIEVPYINDLETLNSWLIKVQNIMEKVFGITSPHCRKIGELVKINIHSKPQITTIRGVLKGSLDDLENGFLLGQEFLIAGDVFDSVLEEAKHLLKADYKAPAAVLGRVVIEDSVKRLARLEQIDDTKKASVLNDELKKAGRYNQAQWRQIQVWLDIGNEAAHGNITQYSKEQVREQIEGIEHFIANEFKI